jgi:predicted aspartyl protease
MKYAPNLQKNFFYTELPYKIENGWITFTAKINNSEKYYNFIFDTGATTMISEKLISELKLENGITSVSKDINGYEISGFSFLTNLTIGELNIDNIRIRSTESDIFSEKCNRKIDGIIGANVLNQGYFYFNYVDKKLIITNELSKLSIDKLKNPIKLKRFMGQPYIKVKGNKKQWLLLDTGYSDGDIILNSNSKILCKSDIPIKSKETYLKGIKEEKKINYSIYNKKIIMEIISYKKVM